MSTRNRVGERAELIYLFLSNRVNEVWRKSELLAELELQDSKTTRRAIARARELAADDNLYLTIPDYDNGYTMGLTDDPSSAVDNALWLARVANGVNVPKHIADDFMRERMSKLSGTERAYIRLNDKTIELTRSVQAAADELVKEMIQERRESRRGGDGSVGV